MPITKKFGGKTYILGYHTFFKSVARAKAKQYRNKGWFARIVTLDKKTRGKYAIRTVRTFEVWYRKR
jgi:hypothetical protein